MVEEQNCEETTNHTPCANNYSFFRSPTTLNLCSKCYKDHCLKEQQISIAKFAVENSLIPPQHQPETSYLSSCGSIDILISRDVVHDFVNHIHETGAGRVSDVWVSQVSHVGVEQRSVGPIGTRKNMGARLISRLCGRKLLLDLNM